jgi:hypothetical protein
VDEAGLHGKTKVSERTKKHLKIHKERGGAPIAAGTGEQAPSRATHSRRPTLIPAKGSGAQMEICNGMGGCGNAELGKTEIGNRKSEIGNRKAESGKRKAESGKLKAES